MRIPKEVHDLVNPARPETRIAVVGASTDRRKFGNIIFFDLLAKGFTVYPVNPNHSEIDGHKTYATVGEIPDRIDIVDFVVPPDVGLEVVEGLDPERTPILWFQPGAGSPEIRARVDDKFPTVIDGPCIMVEATE